jgi:ferric-dicitrate binding protein FerR (iron transport regulator)
MKKASTYQEFQHLMEKYLDQKISQEEMAKLINYYESFQQSHEWVKKLGSEDTIKNKMLQNILKSINEEESLKVVPFYRRKLFKYTVAAAASIALLFSVSYLGMNHATQENRTDILAPAIEIGTDKATLTLEDGSIVILEKGSTYQAKNATSNGEEIVYEDRRPKTEDRSIAYNYLTIPRGGQFLITLSDGTKVWLNSESQLKYPVAFVEGKTRQVELLYGEAYFEVSPSTAHNGATFKVFNKAQEIEVLGTEFNIKAYKDENNIYTTLVEGKVTVKYESKTQDLIPNQQSNYNLKNNTFSIAVVDTFNETSWKEGVFSFDGKSLKEIMTVLSRWYDVEVEFQNKAIESEEFIGVLGKNQNLENILLSIKNFGVIKDYQIKNRKVILK